MGKAPDLVNVHVGRRLRMRRLMCKMSQTDIADALGLTFQQIQKYEKGTNRIGAGRLKQISNVLQVPLDFFFEGSPGQAGTQLGPMPEASWPDYVSPFLATADGLALAKAFLRLEKPLRQRVVELVDQLADGNEG
jgi:transcriptional regulator with XRE-family HTH domain